MTPFTFGGLGAIGSYAMSPLARLRPLEDVLLIDRDSYDASNLAGQDIQPRDVGRLKAHVQARRLRALRPGLTVEALALPIEHVPLGLFADRVFLTAFDSNLARQTVNRISVRLGIRWIDAGVNADAGLVRVSLIDPAHDRPCFECGWDAAVYRALERNEPCGMESPGAAAGPAPTRASPRLSALAASMLVLEAERLVHHQLAPEEFGRHTVFDGTRQRCVVSNWRRYDGCRVADHGPWTIDRLDAGPRALTLGDALDLAPAAAPRRALTVPDVRFVTGLICPRCGARKVLLRLRASLGRRAQTCVACAARMIAVGGDLLERLDPAHLPRRTLGRSLASLGLRPHDVFSVGDASAVRHFVLAGDTAGPAPKEAPA